MKRVLTFLAIMLLPLSVWAMTPVADADLANVTGQTGVNINVDLMMDVSIGTLAWGDDDGVAIGIDTSAGASEWEFTKVGNAGYVGISNFNIYSLSIQARLADTYDGYETSVQIKPVTIDVVSGLPEAYSGHGLTTTFVRIGLGALEITMNDLLFDVNLGEDATTNFNEKLGSVYVGGLGLYIDPASYIDIYNDQNGTGVTFYMSIEIDHIDLDTLAWGDDDGYEGDMSTWLGTGNTGGWVGLSQITMGIVNVTGEVSIDVVTGNLDAIYGHLGLFSDTALPNPTVVRISFPSMFSLDVEGPITAFVKLADAYSLNSTNASTLGDIYISGFGLDIYGGSWIDIWAH